MAFYYKYEYGGKVTRTAKVENGVPYGYKMGEWVHMPDLSSIMFDVGDDAVEITEKEANELIANYTPTEWDLTH